MSRNNAVIVGVGFLIAMLSSGCTTGDRVGTAPHGADVVPAAYQAFDGRTGEPMSFDQLIARCARADVVLFGEEHNNRTCNELEASLLAALCRTWPLTALQMEFFESDTQAAINDYLRDRIDETTFLERTRQGKAYATSHRPMIEFCKSRGVPVVAANAPRKLVREFRRLGQEYFHFRSSLPPTDFRWLPRQFRYLAGGYRERFMEVTKGHPPVNPPPSTAASGGTAAPPPPMTPEQRREQGYLTQLLWDNSMSESLAGRRWLHERERQMLVVGGFHVERGGGTATFFRQRRPQDKTCVVIYRSAESGTLAFDAADRGVGDIVVYGVPPAEEPSGPPPAQGTKEGTAAQGATQPPPVADVPPSAMPSPPPAAAMPTEAAPSVAAPAAGQPAQESLPPAEATPAEPVAGTQEVQATHTSEMPAPRAAPTADTPTHQPAPADPGEPATAETAPTEATPTEGAPADASPVQTAPADAVPAESAPSGAAKTDASSESPIAPSPAEQPAPGKAAAETQPSGQAAVEAAGNAAGAALASQPVRPYLREASKVTPTTQPASKPAGS